MFDILSLILISIFFPVIVLVGKMLYKKENINRKLIVGLTITFLAMELLRFFVVASYYDGAIIPSEEVPYSFITLSCIVCLFAVFNKGKLGKIFQGAFCLTSLVPIIWALFDSAVYTNAYDTHAVAKALYFLECGIILTISILIMSEQKITAWSNLWAAVLLIVFAALDCLVITFWGTRDAITLMWGITLIVSFVSIGAVYGIYLLACHLSKKQKAKTIESGKDNG